MSDIEEVSERTSSCAITQGNYTFRNSEASILTKHERVSIAQSLLSEMDLGNSGLLNSENDEDDIDEEEN